MDRQAPKIAPFQGKAVGLTISFEVHVSALLLARAIALQAPFELI